MHFCFKMTILLKALYFLPFFFTSSFTQPLFFTQPLIFKSRNSFRSLPIDPLITGGSSNNIGDGDNRSNSEANDGNYHDENEYSSYKKGWWELASKNSGVSAMHMFIFPNTNKAIMIDAPIFGPSQIKLPLDDCNHFIESKLKNDMDCWAHSVEFDFETAAIRPLKVLSDTWSSSGGLSADGTLVHAGGWSNGGRSVRYLSGVCSSCDWDEYPNALSGMRWYSTQHIMPDGSFILVGGRGMFNYEYIPKEGEFNFKNFKLPFLQQTTDIVENNLYPFVFLSIHGNLFIFANNRSILLNPSTNTIIREYPILTGGSRNYPASGMAVLLPIKLHDPNPNVIQAEVLICGGGKPEAAKLAETGTFLTALQDCGRINITDPNATWMKETMPTPRVMGDMLILPTGDILMINGAKKGTSGWNFADDPNLVPVLYKPENPKPERFTELNATTIPRMYHSTSAVLPDGKILVAGSNTNYYYNITGVKYPTELRVEKFYPPYLDPLLAVNRPLIVSDFMGKTVEYGQDFVIQFKLKEFGSDQPDLKVTMYAPPFTTHGFSMNQRLLVLSLRKFINVDLGNFEVTVVAPPTATIAPPGYYLVFVIFRGVPSPGTWVHIINRH